MRVCAVIVLSVVVALVTAGCPPVPAETTTVTPGSGSGASGSGSGSGSDPSGVGSGSSGGSDTSTGDGGATTVVDSLTTEFPGCEEPADGEAWRAEVLRLVNQVRATNEADPLTRNETLEDQATQYACEMIFYDFFAHENPETGTELQDRADEFGYQYVWIGENLAAGQRSPAEVVTAWLESPCHRKNLLHPAFTELGVGVRAGGSFGYYWTQEFGRPVSVGAYVGPEFTVAGCP